MISSTKNPRIVDARKLSQRKHRYRQNRFLVEGLQLLGMALAMMQQGASHIIPAEVFYNQDLFTGDIAPRLLAQLERSGAEAFPVTPAVLDTLSQRDTSQGLVATFALSELIHTAETWLQAWAGSNTPGLILVLDQLQDPGNLGTLIRTADAVGARAVILHEPCVDPFDPKTVRGTMGSLFTVPLVRMFHPQTVLPVLTHMGYRLVGADASRGPSVWESTPLRGSTALVLGNEAHGLTAPMLATVPNYVSLPLVGRAESLNVSVAGGILMYEWLRQN